MKVNRGREPNAISDLRGPTFTGTVWATQFWLPRTA